MEKGDIIRPMSSKVNNNAWSSLRQKKSVKEIVVYELVDAMLDGRLPIGTSMPPEPEMCKRLGVSRVTFREAVKQLEVLGFLRIDRGNGTIVTPPTFSCLEPIIEFLGKSKGVSFKDLHQVRTLIEVEAVKLVAATRTRKLVGKLQDILDEVEKNFNRKSVHIDLDYEFHRIILEACPNRLLPLILSPFTAQLHKSRSMSFKNLETSRKTLETHRSILDAIRRGNAEEASATMARHLENTARDLGIWDNQGQPRVSNKKPLKYTGKQQTLFD